MYTRQSKNQTELNTMSTALILTRNITNILHIKWLAGDKHMSANMSTMAGTPTLPIHPYKASVNIQMNISNWILKITHLTMSRMTHFVRSTQSQ